MQLIDGNGRFNVDGLKDFMTATEFAQSGLSYAIVAIIGSQSSGKSTLMNQTFHTNFEEMDAYNGRGQTTKGIWIAKCSDIDPFTIAMDFEGTDSNQRGEDDTAFEKQSTLFALEIADVVLINMWYKDIGLENAASRPLLKTVFQVMKRLFKPRKKTLLFVLRDHSKTPLEHLKTALLEDIEKIWAAVAEPETLCSVPLREFFNVEITALPRYEFQEEKFKEQVAQLRQRFVHSIYPGGLVGDREEVEPASGFPLRAEKIWKKIKDNRDLDLPAVKVMVATVRCEEIADAAIQQSEWNASKSSENLICDKLSEMMAKCKVSPEATTLLKPEDCKSLWMNFIEKIKPMVTGARSRQDGHRKTGSYAATAVAAAAAVAATVAAAAAAGAVVAGPAAVLNAGVATFMRVMRL